MKMSRTFFVVFLLAVTFGSRVRIHAQSFLTNGLVAYYQFNNPGNTSISDSSGNENNGQIIGNDWQYSPDRLGNPTSSLFLNLTDPPNTNAGTYVAVPRNAALDFNQNFTLTVWVNIPNGLPPYHVHNLIGNGLDANSANFRIISAADTNGNDYLQFVGNHDTGDIHAFLAPLRNCWWQAVVVRSGTNVSLFQNGSFVTNSGISATLLNLPQIWFGAMPLTTNETPSLGDYPLDGGIDDVRIYNRALALSEVQQLYLFERGPIVALVQAVKPTFSNLSIGTNYQLQVSSDLNSWSNQGSPFVATGSVMTFPQYFDATNGVQLFFRLQVAP